MRTHQMRKNINSAQPYSGIHSTPVSTKNSSRSNDEMMSFLCELFNELRGDMNNRFDVNDKKLDKRLNESQKQFNELRGDINEIKEQKV